MPPGAETVWHWEFDPWVLALILLPGVLYVCGWRQVHRQMPHRFGAARLAAFLAGLAALVIAIASPLDACADLLLTAHMLQHPHSIGFSGGQVLSYVEGSSALDFPLIHNM